MSKTEKEKLEEMDRLFKDYERKVKLKRIWKSFWIVRCFKAIRREFGEN